MFNKIIVHFNANVVKSIETFVALFQVFNYNLNYDFSSTYVMFSYLIKIITKTIHKKKLLISKIF
jgi:hypothetical protein